MKYGIEIDLRYEAGPHDDPASEVESIVEHLIDLEPCTAGLLDSTVGMDLAARTVKVELTVEAGSAGAALDLAVSYLRTAIHAAGGSTPGWENEPTTYGHIAFIIDDAEGLNVRRLQLAPA